MKWKAFLLIWLGVLAIIGNLLFLSMAVKHLDIAKSLPMEFSGYVGKDLELKKYVYDILGSTNVLARSYKKGDFEAEVSIVASFSDRLVIHPPEVCMHGSGAGIKNRNIVRLCGVEFNHMIASYGKDYTYDVYYLYGIDKQFFVNYYKFQTSCFLNKVLRKKRPAYLFRIIVYNADKEDLNDFICKIIRSFNIDLAVKN